MTKRLLKSIQEQSMSKTFVEVAESVGDDEKTVFFSFTTLQGF
jgi:hypothetical protein